MPDETPSGPPQMPPMPPDHRRDRDAGGAAVVERKKARTKPPALYQVVMLNDDYTPMEFVVIVLETFFAMSRENATRVMLHVHTQGKGICGVFTRDVADTKVAQVNAFSRAHQHPLMCAMEEA